MPSGAAVTAGTATISAPASNSLLVTQSSDKAIIDWSGFSIGAGNAVQFDNGTGATLNRVTGDGQSAIDGSLSATGSLYLINPNGIIIGKDGKVNVGGSFVASSLDVSDQNFLAGGDTNFAGASTAAVVNLGSVGALGGDVALIARTVENAGTIGAPNGTVGLIAGTEVLMRDKALDDGKFAVVVGGAGTSVTNSGAISAAAAELRANGGNVYALAGNTGGLIRATGVASQGGRVFLTAPGGSIKVSGSIRTTRLPKPGVTAVDGGYIFVTGKDVAIIGSLDASGSSGGAGGSIETSGDQVDFDGAKITAGPGGSWLVDPDDLVIDEAAAELLSETLQGGTDVTLTTTNSAPSSTPADIGNDVSSGNGDILVEAGVGWDSSATLTLDAYRDIDIDADMEIADGGGLTLNAGRSLFFREPVEIDSSTSPVALNYGTGNLYFQGGWIDFLDPAVSPATQLSINSTPYVLVPNIATLATDVAADSHGDYALANDVVAQVSYSGAPILTPLDGTFEGLGHVISNLSMTVSSADPFDGIGLFAQIDGSATVRDIGLLNETVTGGDGEPTGGLAGENDGQIVGSWASGTFAANGGAFVGGLVGHNLGSITESFADGTVGAIGGSRIGGLVGQNEGTVSYSYASAAVSGSDSFGTGGLVGYNTDAISDSYATGAVTELGTGSSAVAGGLVGYNEVGATVDASYAIGAVTATDPAIVLGAFVGTNDGMLGGTAADYFDAGINGPMAGVGDGAGSASGLAALSADQFRDPTQMSGLNFGDADTPDSFLVLDSDDGINETGPADIDGTRPFLSWEFSTRITNIHQLQLMALRPDLDYYLWSDVDAHATAVASDMWSSAGFIPVGTPADPFTGFFNSFDPDGDSIYSLTIDRPSTNYVGLFGYRAQPGCGCAADITGVSLEGGSITGHDYVGALAGYDDGDIGYPGAGQMLFSDAVSGHAKVGGIVGEIDNSSLLEVLNYGDVTGTGGQVGGVAGVAADDMIAEVVDLGDVDGGAGDMVGGLVGEATDPSNSGGSAIYYSSVSGNVSGHDDVGGLVGSIAIFVAASGATGTVTGNENVGGLVGNNQGSITASFADGDVAGVDQIGGLVGYNGASIDNSYAMGTVTASNGDAGGLIGLEDFTGGATDLFNVFATGFVDAATGPEGGLIGATAGSGSITTAYWDIDTTGQSSSAGQPDSDGKSTLELQAGLNFGPGDDADDWSIVAGKSYPYLGWQVPYGTPQIVSGSLIGTSGQPIPGQKISLVIDGQQPQPIASMSTGANGYYYELLEPGSLNAGDQMAAASPNAGGLTLFDNAGDVASSVDPDETDIVRGVDIFDTYLTLITDGPSLSGAASDLMAAFSSPAVTVPFILSTIPNLNIESTGSHFDIDALDPAADPDIFAISGVAGDAITQDVPINAKQLLLLGADASFELSNPDNGIGTDVDAGVVAVDAGTISLSDEYDLTIGSVNEVAGVTSTGSVTIATDGDLTIAAGAKVSGGMDDDIILAATGGFDNEEGADAIALSGDGNWLVYSADPTDDSFGPGPTSASYLDSGNTAIWGTTFNPALPEAVTGADRYIFATDATLTVTARTLDKTYGVDATADIASSYDITGYEPGVVGAFLTDDASTALSGTIKLTSAGAVASAPVVAGGYAYAISNASPLDGYTLEVSGMLTVDPATLTIDADAGTKVYGSLDPSLGYSVDGLVNSDTDSIVTGGLSRAAGENVGHYAIDQGSLTAGNNYTIAYAGADFDITPATLTIDADGDSKVYGSLDPSLGYSIGGLVNQDTDAVLTGSLNRAGGENVGYYTIGEGSLSAGDNYTIAYTGADFAITPATLTIDADDRTKVYGSLDPSLGYSIGGLVNRDTDAVLTGSLDRAVGENVGHYAIAEGSLSAGDNYTIAYTGADFGITPADLEVTAEDAAKVANDVPYSGGNGVSFSGFSNGDGASALGGSLVYGGSAQGAVAAGRYSIAPSGLISNNYIFDYVNGTLTITAPSGPPLPPDFRLAFFAQYPQFFPNGANGPFDWFAAWLQLCHTGSPAPFCPYLPYPANWRPGDHIGWVAAR